MSPSRRALVGELDRYDRLLEVGIGTRPEVATALAERGREVVAVDVDIEASIERSTADSGGSSGSLRLRDADVVALAAAEDPLAMLVDEATAGTGEPAGFDAVYGLNLPAELQRPVASLADRIDADGLFTTLGFEEPVVPVERRSIDGRTLYVVSRTRHGSR